MDRYCIPQGGHLKEYWELAAGSKFTANILLSFVWPHKSHLFQEDQLEKLQRQSNTESDYVKLNTPDFDPDIDVIPEQNSHIV